MSVPPNGLLADAAEHWLHTRRTTLPKRLQGPGPDAAQKSRILLAASAAPDHQQILPWRFVEVTAAKRNLLAQAFAQALHERDAKASAQELDQAREKAHRAPWLLLAICRTEQPEHDGEDHIPTAERLVSLGCALQNMMLMCTALGLGSSLTSGKAMHAQAFRQLFALPAHESAICCLNIGHIQSSRTNRPRPSPADYFSAL